MSASGYSRSAVWWRNHDSPRLQAFLALRIRTPSVCNSMSSQKQPQNVHVASFTIVRVTLSLLLVGARPSNAARTGRHDELSNKLPAAIASSTGARAVAPGFDHLPRRGVFFVIFGHQADDQPIRSVVEM